VGKPGVALVLDEEGASTVSVPMSEGKRRGVEESSEDEVSEVGDENVGVGAPSGLRSGALMGLRSGYGRRGREAQPGPPRQVVTQE